MVPNCHGIKAELIERIRDFFAAIEAIEQSSLSGRLTSGYRGMRYAAHAQFEYNNI